ncbi:MAG: SDR family oxidoreductase [Gammaproteobacteria bacterium]|nr:SDR family oxidoreductase [Gammaproteobacteria bacterium]
MDLGIKDRVALITGAGRNIGRAIALTLADEGARVIAVGRTAADLETLITEIGGPTGRHTAITLDLQLPDAAIYLRNMLLGDFENPSIIVHNMGGSLKVTDPFAPVCEWSDVWHYNVGVSHELNRMFTPFMVTQKWGRVVHLSTLATKSHAGYPAYVSAKCALDGYVQAVSKTLSRNNVVLSALAPGLIDLEGRYFNLLKTKDPARLEDYFNNHLPIHRMGSAQEIAKAAAFLCSEHAAFMPGAIVRIDGGGN